jgi:catechol 2,3-dioxygenase-like lactoylglutathione lyase family enzyme
MPRLTVTGTNIDAPDANALADFYRRLLGWTTRTEEPGWVVIQPGAGDQARGGTLSFQTESRYVRPVWPAGPGDPQMMMHLEIKVDDLAPAVAPGATLAGFQPQEDVRVCLDPAGHPFCLYL